VYLTGDLERSIHALDRAIAHARRTGDDRYVLELEGNLLTMGVVGPAPASEVVQTGLELLDRAALYPSARADILRLIAPMEGVLGRHDDAGRHVVEALAIVDDLGRRWDSIVVRLDRAWVERLAGDLEAAERTLRQCLVDNETIGDTTTSTFATSRLAVILVLERRFDEALPFVADAESVPVLTNRSRLLGARARIRASTGDVGAREEVAAVLASLSGSAFIHLRTDALVDAGEVEAELGDPAAAVRFFEEALDLCARKENLVLASQLRARIADLSAAASPVA
jgi:tetratricopeptide (TPR) repeat protein